MEEAAQIRGESRELERCEFEDVLDALDEKYRIILVLYYGEGFKYGRLHRFWNWK